MQATLMLASLTVGLLAPLLPAVAVAQAPVERMQPQDSTSAAEAEAFIDLLRRSAWDSAAARIAPAVPAGQLGAGQLSAVWGQVEAAAGELQSVRLHRVTAMDTLRAVELIGHFSAQPLLFRVVLTPASEVTGFWIGPAPDAAVGATSQNRTPVATAPYADPARFVERDVVIGHEPWALPGTLTLPSSPGPHPVVVLVHGSGPHDRDARIGPNRPFRDLAHGLATHGVGVLRYDKRTLVHGARMGAEVTADVEVVEDALAAIELARTQEDVDSGRVFLLGHSLGGLLAPHMATRDGRVAGVILLAAPARDMIEVVEAQLEYLGGMPMNAAPAAQTQITQMLDRMDDLRSGTLADTANVMGAPAAYWRDLRRYDAVASARELDVPLLVLQGERDYQVTMADFRLWNDALEHRPTVTLRSFDALNHLFMTGSGAPSPAEYQQPGHVAEEVVRLLADWVRR